MSFISLHDALPISHRDDVELHLGTAPAKGFASHGETWSYAIALRFAEFQLLRSEDSDPILILDDVFSELDAKRREKLVKLAADVEQEIGRASCRERVRLMDDESPL